MIERATESFAFASGKIDRSGTYPIIRGALLCGRESAWRRRYSRRTFEGIGRLQRYEGKPVYLNHTNGPSGERSYESQIGWIVEGSVRHNADGLPVGDIALKPTHPCTASVLWDVQNRPKNCMLSHVADIDVVQGPDGWKDVRECRYIASVDIVTQGATTKSMFSEGGKPMLRTTVREYATGAAPRLPFESLKRLHKLCMEGYGGETIDSPLDAGDDGTDSAFLSVCMKEVKECMAAAGDRDKLKKCLSRLKKILMTHAGLNDAPDDDTDTEAKEGYGGHRGRTSGVSEAALAMRQISKDLRGVR